MLKLKNRKGEFQCGSQNTVGGYLNLQMCFAIVLVMLFISCNTVNNKKSQQILAKNNKAIEKITELTKENILVCAHRSYHKLAPENSLQSIKNAIEANIDIVEIDVRTTKDSVLVLMHDNTIDRTTTGKGMVTDYTYKELQQFNLKIGDSITHHKIPLVKEALKKVKEKLIPNLDLKAVNYQQLYKMLQELEMEHEVISYIGKRRKIHEMIGIDSLYAVLPMSKTKEDMIYYNEYTKSTLQHFSDESFTEENMKWIHEKGELVFVNTLWDEDEDFIEGKMQSMDSVIAFFLQ
jgi:glycerophosphoryl diester phosphodiesterase